VYTPFIFDVVDIVGAVHGLYTLGSSWG